MEQAHFQLPLYFEYGATFIWALSSALLAARRGYAILGMLTLALVGAAGGGLLRDGLFLQQGPPILITSPELVWLIVLAVVCVIAFGRRVERLPYLNRLVAVFDAIGLGAYAVIGMDRATAAGVSLPGIVIVGMANAVGGGILRDILLNREPTMFKPGVLEEVVALLGCMLFLTMTRFLPFNHQFAAWITIFVVFAVRIIAIRKNIASRPVKDFEKLLDPTE